MYKFYFRRKVSRTISVDIMLVAGLVVGSVFSIQKVSAQSYGTTTTTSSTSSTMPLVSSTNQGLITITPSILPDGTVNAPYSQTITASTTQAGPFSWKISGGSLPPGLVFGSNNGMNAILSGTPTTAGEQFTFSVSLTNNTSAAATQTYVMNINPNNATTSLATSTASISSSSTLNTTTGTNASSVSDLQAELNTLTLELIQLENESGGSLSNNNGGGVGVNSGVSCGSAMFCRDLTLGSVGPDVVALQQFLNQNGNPVAQSGPGSSGNETEYFGILTQTALTGWQSANGISPARGYFGPITRAAIEQKVSASGSSGNNAQSGSSNNNPFGSSNSPSRSSGSSGAPMIPTQTSPSQSSSY